MYERYEDFLASQVGTAFSFPAMHVSLLLSLLLKKNKVFSWSQTAEEAFILLKGALISDPILALPDFSKPFLVTTDASGQAIGGVLSQERRPIAYESRKLRTHELNYPTHDLELLAVVHALKMWRHYLLGNSFTIKTDHKSLKWIFTQPKLNMRQRKWLELLHEYDFNIEYQSGNDSVVWLMH